MKIGGFQKFSLIDYPGKICAIIFTQGCNFRCPYCYNIDLVLPEHFKTLIEEKEIFSFLKQRKGKLDAVEITGGEPTLQPDLIDFIKKIKSMGFLVKLDSNGSNPEKLEEALKYVDYVAMDIKAPLEKYNLVCGVEVNLENIRRSIKIIMDSGLDYQFRTTVVKPFLNFEDLKKISNLIKGTQNYIVQNFNPADKIMDSSLLDKEEYNEEQIKKFQDALGKLSQRKE